MAGGLHLFGVLIGVGNLFTRCASFCVMCVLRLCRFVLLGGGLLQYNGVCGLEGDMQLPLKQNPKTQKKSEPRRMFEEKRDPCVCGAKSGSVVWECWHHLMWLFSMHKTSHNTTNTPLAWGMKKITIATAAYFAKQTY